ncbi:MAG TPA: hypothetical protein VFS43_32345 [Polyangiaceae bacterium]|nr:hypothetical protein [Polyangiaceae bacterium]
MTTSIVRRFALSLSLFSFAVFGASALGGCAGGGADPAPEGPSDPTEVAASEGCDDEEALAANGVTKAQCLEATVVVEDPNSGEANGCVAGTVLFKKVDPGPPRLVSICKCRADGTVNCFIRN